MSEVHSARRPVVAVPLGDPGGIGPEVALKAATDERIRQKARLLMVGSAAVLRSHADALAERFSSPGEQERALPELAVVPGVPDRFPEGALPVLDVAEPEAPGFSFGEVTRAGGRLSMRAVERAVELCDAGAADAMTTAPISKAAIARAGYRAPGHTEFIAEKTSGPGQQFEPLMLMVGAPAVGDASALRVGLVSVHEPLAQAPRSVTPGAIRRKLEVLTGSLRRDFGAQAPRIAVLGLNPHAGDDGALGEKEETIIAPALRAARHDDGLAEQGATLDGPLPADGFFGTRGWERYDAVLAMYHDQGLAPFKALTFGKGVNVTAGLPVVRTSPDHGTAFDIAGEGCAHPGSMKAALRLATDIAQRRQAVDRRTQRERRK
ncbi:MAG: 4-hydroxythreonine-4-phosphate dehydrogenase PdxA [Bacteroidetes bacterium QS_9_68_14]|nr:MAG: 4-hydroxythreonine-4-phosphate dehydrogenase PdxA [Bacteroidetes bacterium QS_9_68_14]